MLNYRLFTVLSGVLLTLSIMLLPGTGQAEDNRVNSVRIESTLEFDSILITDIDLVFVYDTELLSTFPTTKQEWFRQKYDILDSHPRSLDVITTNAPQGFSSATPRIPERAANAVKVFISADHEGQTVPLHDITTMTDVLVRIDEFGILVSSR